jgi:hypothetical protein
VLTRWQREASSWHIGAASSRVVSDLVVRKAAQLLNRRNVPSAGFPATVEAERDSGGNAALIAWLPFPDAPPDCYLCLGTRSSRKTPAAPWRLRPGVQVNLNASRDVGEARALAHDLAMQILPALRLPSLQQRLNDEGQPSFAAALSGRQEGLRRQPDQTQQDQWRKQVLSGASAKAPPHPVLFHDWGRRLASSLTLDVTGLTMPGLVELMLITLEHLHRAADPQTSDGKCRPRRSTRSGN